MQNTQVIYFVRDVRQINAIDGVREMQLAEVTNDIRDMQQSIIMVFIKERIAQRSNEKREFVFTCELSF